MNKIAYTWQQFDTDIAALAHLVTGEGWIAKFDAIYGVPRGGLVMAVALSHRVGMPVATDLGKNSIRQRLLVVDDISDSGKTLSMLRGMCVCCATIHYVKGSLIEPDMWIREKTKGDWIVYPWEADK